MLVTLNRGTEYEHATDIRVHDPHRHKYADALAEYVDLHADRFYDNASGDVECPTGWFAIVGRRLIRHDDRGFVWVETYADKDGAERVFDALNALYCAWGDEDAEDDEREDAYALAADRATRVIESESHRAAERSVRGSVGPFRSVRNQ